MDDIAISPTCADYARVMPLATGEVKPEGIALTMILGSRGSWPARAEMLRRAVQDPAAQGGEWSMPQYLYRIEEPEGASGLLVSTGPRAGKNLSVLTGYVSLDRRMRATGSRLGLRVLPD